MLDGERNDRCGCVLGLGLLVTEVSKSWRTLWKRWPICGCVAVTNDSAETRTKCSDQTRVQKDTGPEPFRGGCREGRAEGRHMPSRDEGLAAASVLTLRAEEPRT